MPYLPSAIFVLFAALGASAPALMLDGGQPAQVIMRDRVVIRVRNMPMPPPPPSAAPLPPVRWVERKGPKCVAVSQLGGAIVGGKSVDLVLHGGERVRAMLDGDCPALDFYSGFYLKPSADGMVCAKRDTIRSRSGDSCEIAGFRRLVIKR